MKKITLQTPTDYTYDDKTWLHDNNDPYQDFECFLGKVRGMTIALRVSLDVENRSAYFCVREADDPVTISLPYAAAVAMIGLKPL